MICMAPVGPAGVSEIRATYGGLFVSLGIVAIALQTSIVFTVAGLAWLGAALGRVFSIAIDHNFDSKNLGGVIIEMLIGSLPLMPAISSI